MLNAYDDEMSSSISTMHESHSVLVGQQRRVDEQRMRIKELDDQVESLIQKGRLAELEAEAANRRAEVAQEKAHHVDERCSTLNQEIFESVSNSELRHIDDLQALSQQRDRELEEVEFRCAQEREGLHRGHAQEIERLQRLVAEQQEDFAARLKAAEAGREAAESAWTAAESRFGTESTAQHERLHEAYHCTLEAKEMVEVLTRKLQARDQVLEARGAELASAEAHARDAKARMEEEGARRSAAEEAEHQVKLEVDTFVRRIRELESAAARAQEELQAEAVKLLAADTRADDLAARVRVLEGEGADLRRRLAEQEAAASTAESRRQEAEAHSARAEREAAGREALLRQGMVELDDRRRAEAHELEERRKQAVEAGEARVAAARAEGEERLRDSLGKAEERRQRDLQEADERRAREVVGAAEEARRLCEAAAASREEDSARKVREMGGRLQELVESKGREIDGLRSSLEDREGLLVQRTEQIDSLRASLEKLRATHEATLARCQAAETALPQARERVAMLEGRMDGVEAARAVAEAARQQTAEQLQRSESDARGLRQELSAASESHKASQAAADAHASSAEQLVTQLEAARRELADVGRELRDGRARESALGQAVELTLQELREVKAGADRESRQQGEAHSRLAVMEERLVGARQRIVEAAASSEARAAVREPPPPSVVLGPLPAAAPVAPSVYNRTPPRHGRSPPRGVEWVAGGSPMHIPATGDRPAILLGSPHRLGSWSTYKHPIESPIGLSYYRGGAAWDDVARGAEALRSQVNSELTKRSVY